MRRLSPARAVGAAAGLALAVGLIAAAHYYLARRLVLDPGLPQPWRGLALAGIGLGFVGLFAQPLMERRFRHLARLRAFSWPFVVWMGVFWIALVVVAAGDAAVALIGAASSVPPDVTARWLAGIAGLAIVVGSAVALAEGLRAPRVRELELALPRWPAAFDGFRIAQISDIHIGPVLGRRFLGGVVARVNALGADLVAVTGDLVDGSVEALRDEVEPLADLRAPCGAFFVTGNHDFYSGGEAWAARVRELGLRVLRNERVAIERAGAGFDLAGVDDHRGDWVRGSSEDLPAALAGRDASRPVVLLAHDPSTFRRAAAEGVDLQLSGHTHGGQIWPFHALVRLAVPFVAGRYERGGAQLYVSRGTGFWGPPMRLGAPSEITLLTLRRAAAEPAA